MSDIGEDFKALEEHKMALRRKYGLPCPICLQKLPRANPKILLPQQSCRMHKYVDPRPELTNQQWTEVT